MRLEEVLKNLQQEKHGEVLTSWKEIPIKVKLQIKWISPEDRFVSFDVKSCKFKHFFTGQNEIYAKIKEFYFTAKIFSNIKDELVLELESVAPPPPIILREFIRVQPSDKEPVYVSFCISNDCVARVKVEDISEAGIGFTLTKDEADKIVFALSEIAQDIRKVHTPIEMEIELPKGERIKATGELRNLLSKEDGLYVRFGFQIKLKEEDAKKIRQYISKRQREILETLKQL